MRAVLIIIVGRVLQLAAAFLTLRLATTLLSPAEVGRMNQLVSVATLFASGLLLPVVQYFARGVVGWSDAGLLPGRIASVLLLFLGAATVVAVPVAVAQYAVGFVEAVPLAWFVGLLFLYLVVFPAHSLTLNCTAVLGQRGRSALYGNAASWGGLGLAVLLAAAYGGPWAWALGIFLGYALGAQGLWHYRHETIRRETVRTEGLDFTPARIFAFAWPQTVVFALWWWQSQSYRFLVPDVAAVGLFLSGYALCSVPMQAFESAFNEVYAPRLFRQIEQRTGKDLASAWMEYARAYMPVVILFGCFLVACAPLVASIALGSKFHAVAGYLLLPALTETARALSSSIHTMGVVKTDMRSTLPCVGAGALVAPALLWAVAAQEPLMGTGVALFGAAVAVLGMAVTMTKIALPVRWPVARMASAALAGLPLVTAGLWLGRTAPESVVVVVLFIAVLSAYLSAMLYLFSRGWLFKRPNDP